MITSGKPFTTITFEDGSIAVVRADFRKPRFLELIAIFYEASRARSYAEIENGGLAEELPIESKEAPRLPSEAAQHHNGAAAKITPDLSPRQSAVLQALREKMDENKRVEAKAAAMAEAANIPLGSLHSVLQSLEKKKLIKMERSGSAKAPAVYEVL